MIYLFTGDDTKKKNIAYEKLLKTFEGKVEIFSIGKNDFNPVQVESFYSSSGLFFSTCVVVLNNIFEREEARDFLLKKIGEMRESENVFIVLESKLKKTEIDIFTKKKAIVNIFELPKSKKEKFDNFLLAYDLEKRDKLNLWIHFRQAIDKGVGMEELIGILFWKAKDMILKRNFSKFKESELKVFASRLSYLLPEARKEGKSDEEAFEQFLLEAF
jgi:hypothetical protein